MKAQLLQPKRYQLKKDSLTIVRRGHPWIFRSHVSSAAGVFPNGQWLQLVDHENKTQGYGIYEAQGLIAIRVLKDGTKIPDLPWWHDRIEKALQKRVQLRGFTDAFRAIHGENDRIPGVVVDVYGSVAVLQTYSTAIDGLGRWVAAQLQKKLSLSHVVWKLPVKRKAADEETRLRFLRGTPPGIVSFREGSLKYHVDVTQGQKSGTFLDLRGLRKWVASQDWKGLRVLNLFAYTGTIGLAAEAAGAKEIWNVDVSKGALEFARKYHAREKGKFRWVCEDIFKWLPTLDRSEQFDIIICDPPLMASTTKHLPKALQAYDKLYRSLVSHLKPKGTVIACCCTSRISRADFQRTVQMALGKGMKPVRQILPEDDHPVGFSEGDYLKMQVFSRR